MKSDLDIFTSQQDQVTCLLLDFHVRRRSWGFSRSYSQQGCQASDCDCFSSFVSVKPQCYFKETSGQFAAVSVVTKSDIFLQEKICIYICIHVSDNQKKIF